MPTIGDNPDFPNRARSRDDDVADSQQRSVPRPSVRVACEEEGRRTNFVVRDIPNSDQTRRRGRCATTFLRNDAVVRHSSVHGSHVLQCIHVERCTRCDEPFQLAVQLIAARPLCNEFIASQLEFFYRILPSLDARNANIPGALAGQGLDGRSNPTDCASAHGSHARNHGAVDRRLAIGSEKGSRRARPCLPRCRRNAPKADRLPAVRLEKTPTGYHLCVRGE